MEESFPRGGKPIASKSDEPSEEKPRQRRKKRTLEKDGSKSGEDFLFGAPKQAPKKKKHKIKNPSSFPNENDEPTTGKHSLLPLGGGGVVLKKNNAKASLGLPTSSEPFIEALGFSKLAKGTKLLGIVREVHDDFVVFSLPNLLTGYVLRSEGAVPTAQAVTVGQVMAVVVVKTAKETIKKSEGAGSNKTPVTRRRIQLSMDPSAVNLRHEEPMAKSSIRGRVQALEDNGMLIDLGHGRKGFLPYDRLDENTYKVKQDDDDDDETHTKEMENSDDRIVLQVGRIQDFIVTKAAKGTNGIVPLSLPSRDQMAKHLIPADAAAAPSIQAITPGWLVKVKVEALARNGLCVTFMGNVFRGALELSHLGGFWIPSTRQVDGSADWKMLFRDEPSPIRSFTARILAVDAATKLVRFTVLPHLMDLCAPPRSLLPAPGTVIEEAIVIRLDPGVGALLAISETENDRMDVDEKGKNNGIKTHMLHGPLTEHESYMEATKIRAAYVHISKAMDDNEDGKTPEAIFAKEFAPSTKHRLRITSTSNLIEGIASGATANSVIEAHVLSHADLIPGQIFKSVPVCAHLNGGAVLVDFGMGVRGVIPAIHLFDQAGTSEFRAKMLKAKYAIDSKVDVRVLSNDPAAKRCILTAKKSLLQDPDTITDYTKCRVGQKATGYISKIDDHGLSVTFFNKVYGRVSAKSLSLELGIDDHRENYKIGDVVRARIVNIKKVRRGRHRTIVDADYEDSDQDDIQPYTRELVLSLRVSTPEDMDTEHAETLEQEASKRVRLHAGAILPMKSMTVVQLEPSKERGDGSYVPGYAIVSIKSKHLIDEAESATMLPYVECKLPFDHLLDDYLAEDRASASTLDALGEKVLPIGKKVDGKGVLMTDPKKSSYEYSTGTGKLTVVSIRPKLVEVAEVQQKETGADKESKPLFLPSPDSHIYVGAKVVGYVAQVDRRHGAFVRFLDGLTGLVPKTKNGLNLEMFSTVVARIETIDSAHQPPKMTLSVATSKKRDNLKCSFMPGDLVSAAEIRSIDFFNTDLKLQDEKYEGHNIKARIFCAMAQCEVYDVESLSVQGKGTKAQSITKYHPFYKWYVGMILGPLKVVAAHIKDGVSHLELTDRLEASDGEKMSHLPPLLTKKEQVAVGTQVSGIVKQIARNNGGVLVQLGPKCVGFIPGLECSTSPEVLNHLSNYFPVGARLECTAIDKLEWLKVKSKALGTKDTFRDDSPSTVYLSLLCKPSSDESKVQLKPVRGDLLVGQIRRKLAPINHPALMLDLRGGYVGRCCITELEEPDDWTNMPLGHSTARANGEKEVAIVSGESEGDTREKDKLRRKDEARSHDEPFPDRSYVQCRVVAGWPSRPVVDVSLRSSRIEGDLDDDEIPETGETVHAYVEETNKKGCFLRLSRKIEGRVILKELADEFLPNPSAAFPPGRLVVGKIKSIKETQGKKEKKRVVDFDMRESTLLENTQLNFSDVELYSKHKGTVTRVESYGVFVRLENSKVSGLAHKSECSDRYVKDPFNIYDPGDLVKVLVIKKDEEQKRIGFSLKASHFKDDEDSDDDESLSEGISDVEDNSNKTDDSPAHNYAENGDLDSEDEDFAAKLAAKVRKESDGEGAQMETDSSDETSKSDDSESSSDNDEKGTMGDGDDEDRKRSHQISSSHKDISLDVEKRGDTMDTDVGFDWNASSSVLAKTKTTSGLASDSDEESMEGDDHATATSHKSRKKQAQKRREEQEIFRRETALADGTADENPETPADFERLISSDPNSSELWIRYMAFHLSLADVSAAREIAERAFARITFREEREKLNVWSALLTLELKYGSSSSLQKMIDRACQQNNPKQVYLRVCEMLEKEINTSSPDTILRADDMFAKMCKKFKSKKKVWIAYLQYLLRSLRHKEAHELLGRALKSLPTYKHVETMSKFAQLEFEFGSPERARTVFDGILLKNPKRLDLVFVYADKEIKYGSVEVVRLLFEKIVNPPPGHDTPKFKFTEKQIKSLFKKWYKVEENYGTPETQEHVKEAARSYVSRTAA